ncbi:MAG: hypothetical protein IT364_08845 [Candidatus Hydrogenedentes bacterium]|nr:hypothetical protein [Candidatus Hydrogenedentota bacterium]
MTQQNLLCTPQELQEKRKSGADFLLLDVRTPAELQTASLSDCMNIPLDKLPGRVGELEAWRDKEIVVMCHHGGRSAQAQGFLLRQGFSRVLNLTGGINAYSVHVDPSIPRY